MKYLRPCMPELLSEIQRPFSHSQCTLWTLQVDAAVKTHPLLAVPQDIL